MTAAATLCEDRLPEIRRILAEMGCDGWLLFDFHGLNPVATRVLGLGGLATRRLFVLIPARGRPVAVAHRIELQRLVGFSGEVRPYATWRELDSELARLLTGKRVAMEYSQRDAVPYLDRVPAGVLELVRSCGAEVLSSDPLVTAVAARWSEQEMQDHRKAAEALRTIALEAFATVRPGSTTEQGLQRWVMEALGRAGLHTDSPAITAAGSGSADPHHDPTAQADVVVGHGEVLLLDLWAGVASGSVFADQTWMAFTGSEVPDEVGRVFAVVLQARDAAVALLRAKWARREAVTGADLDDAAREVVTGAGYGEHFVHRTGHSIDRDLHGSGPHLDNYETSDRRLLLPGAGFSIEPGIYLPGRFGVRSEINCVLHATGPEVTPAAPQAQLILIA